MKGKKPWNYAKITTNCKTCSFEFSYSPALKQKYCSRPCASTGKKGVPNPKTGSKLKKIWVKKNCLTCNKEYEVTPCREKQAKYCSQECRPAWNKGLKKESDNRVYCGEQHHKWKGGVTKLTEYERTLFKKNIQKQVLRRDDYTCQMCDTRGGILHVDHIQSFSEYADLRFSLDNCRTLCRSCHYKVTYGKEMKQDNKWGKGGKYYGI